MATRIFIKLILAVFVVLAVALSAVDVLVTKVAERNYVDTLRRDLIEKGRVIGSLANTADFERLGRMAGTRLTLVARDGHVIADSEAEAANMENHAGRPEIATALSGGEGSSIRRSPTLRISFLYAAVPVSEGALRLAVPLSKIQDQVNAIRKQLLVSTALALIPSVILTALFARSVSRRLGTIITYAGKLARGEFEARLNRAGPDELGTLSAKLNETAQKLQGMFEELQHERAELDRLERIRKDFVINVSHELRTPLASIQGYTETLIDGAIHDPANNIRFLEIVRANAERLGRLTADLLSLSRIELRNQKFQFAHYDVNALLRQHADVLRPMAEKKGIALNVDLAPADTEVYCDAEALHQIVVNLIDNALKYTPGGGAVAVGARPIGSGQVEIYVRDTGIGIPAEELPRLFERFYRVDKARSRDLGGTGLGLAIVKHLVRAHGGEVVVTSAPNQGSTFSFRVPVDPGQPGIQPV